jgi:hypothetical protein
MTDRELLEKAAKAAGIEWVPSDTEKGRECELKFGLWLRIEGEPNEFTPRRFNPMHDDGDALRLAVKLKMSVTVFDNAIGIGIKGDFGYREYEIGDDPQAATRRAIVRAAAAIGEALL